MPNGFLNISHNFAGESQYIVVEWVKSTAQGTPVVGHVTGTGLGAQNDTDATFVYYPAPHVNEQLQVINLSEAWHLVRFWRSSDGTAKDALLLELAGNARTGALFPIQRFEYVVDRGDSEPGVWADPVAGGVGIRDTRLFEKAYWVEERGTASLLAAEITDRSDEGGGFDFVDPFKFMNSGGVYVVYVINKVTSSDGDDSGIVISEDGFYNMTVSEDYNAVTMGGRTILVDIAAEVGTLTIPALAIVPDSRFKVTTHGGTQRNLIILLDVGETVNFRKQAVNQIVLGEGEEIELVVKDGVLYVVDYTTNHERLGNLSWGYKAALNGLLCDGSLLALADYPRVAELIDSLGIASVVNEVTWQTSVIVGALTTYPNKGKFMSDGTNFRPPDLRAMMAKGLAAVDGSIAAGRYENQEVQTHQHSLRGDFIYGGYDGGGNTFWRIRNTTDPFGVGHVIEATGGTNNLVNNIGLFPILCI